MPKAISTARGREFGLGLARALKDAHLRGRAAARITDWDPSKVSHLSHGKGGATVAEVAFLLGCCLVGPEERDHLLKLHGDVDTQGWWQRHGSCAPAQVRILVEHLEIADSVVSWQNHLVPYALRTSNYMRAVVLASANIPPDELRERVQTQAQFDRSGTYYVHESALWTPVNGRDCQVEQLQSLIDRSLLGEITGTCIRIVPFTAGAHAGINGAFTMLNSTEFASMVCVELETSTVFIEDSESISGYRKIIEELDKCSLDIESSRSILKHTLTSFENSDPLEPFTKQDAR